MNLKKIDAYLPGDTIGCMIHLEPDVHGLLPDSQKDCVSTTFLSANFEQLLFS
jgi:hypothetical protein